MNSDKDSNDLSGGGQNNDQNNKSNNKQKKSHCESSDDDQGRCRCTINCGTLAWLYACMRPVIACVVCVGKVAYVSDPLSDEKKAEYVKQIVEVLQPGDLILTHIDGHLSNLFISGRYTHACVFIGTGTLTDTIVNKGTEKEKKITTFTPDTQTDNKTQRASGGAVVIESTGDNGVSYRYIHNLITDKFGVAVLRNDFLETKDEVDKFISLTETLVGKEYDFLFIKNNDKYYCSEILTERLINTVGRDRFEKKIGKRMMYEPSDYYDSLPKKLEVDLKRK
ncbi:hypothetical protein YASMINEVIRUS_630 [Yasminevirus sp. GU-2018]|uniref:Protein OPG091 n=1 Tax=Yasminevirus sp. GU-2018 TaxID=2420051 RepID=A0A5K0U8G4_9VIRU|nr:hypothetical protein YASMINEVIRUS_630 [Yasminevirus sp. GU-2018]